MKSAPNTTISSWALFARHAGSTSCNPSFEQRHDAGADHRAGDMAGAAESAISRYSMPG